MFSFLDIRDGVRQLAGVVAFLTLIVDLFRRWIDMLEVPDFHLVTLIPWFVLSGFFVVFGTLGSIALFQYMRESTLLEPFFPSDDGTDDEQKLEQGIWVGGPTFAPFLLFLTI